jgi:hypothetical protein
MAEVSPRKYFHIDNRAKLMAAILASSGKSDDLYTGSALSVAVGTSLRFEQLRCRGQGPNGTIIGGRLYYRREDVISWLNQRAQAFNDREKSKGRFIVGAGENAVTIFHLSPARRFPKSSKKIPAGEEPAGDNR